MNVILAKSAGFCYGVERAVELAHKTAGEHGGCRMLGDLIHNSHPQSVRPGRTAGGGYGPYPLSR